MALKRSGDKLLLDFSRQEPFRRDSAGKQLNTCSEGTVDSTLLNRCLKYFVPKPIEKFGVSVIPRSVCSKMFAPVEMQHFQNHCSPLGIEIMCLNNSEKSNLGSSVPVPTSAELSCEWSSRPMSVDSSDPPPTDSGVVLSDKPSYPTPTASPLSDGPPPLEETNTSHGFSLFHTVAADPSKLSTLSPKALNADLVDTYTPMRSPPSSQAGGVTPQEGLRVFESLDMPQLSLPSLQEFKDMTSLGRGRGRGKGSGKGRGHILQLLAGACSHVSHPQSLSETSSDTGFSFNTSRDILQSSVISASDECQMSTPSQSESYISAESSLDNVSSGDCSADVVQPTLKSHLATEIDSHLCNNPCSGSFRPKVGRGQLLQYLLQVQSTPSQSGTAHNSTPHDHMNIPRSEKFSNRKSKQKRNVSIAAVFPSQSSATTIIEPVVVDRTAQPSDAGTTVQPQTDFTSVSTVSHINGHSSLAHSNVQPQIDFTSTPAASHMNDHSSLAYSTQPQTDSTTSLPASSPIDDLPPLIEVHSQDSNPTHLPLTTSHLVSKRSQLAMRSSGDDLSEEVRLQKSGRSNDEREQRIARLQRSIHCRQVELKKLQNKSEAMAKELACEIHEADDEDKHYISPDRINAFDNLLRLNARAVVAVEGIRGSEKVREDFKREYDKLGLDKRVKMELELVLAEDDAKEKVEAAKAKINLLQGKLDFYVNDV